MLCRQCAVIQYMVNCRSSTTKHFEPKPFNRIKWFYPDRGLWLGTSVLKKKEKRKKHLYLLGEFCNECEADSVPSERGLAEISFAVIVIMESTASGVWPGCFLDLLRDAIELNNILFKVFKYTIIIWIILYNNMQIILCFRHDAAITASVFCVCEDCSSECSFDLYSNCAKYHVSLFLRRELNPQPSETSELHVH